MVGVGVLGGWSVVWLVFWCGVAVVSGVAVVWPGGSGRTPRLGYSDLSDQRASVLFGMTARFWCRRSGAFCA